MKLHQTPAPVERGGNINTEHNFQIKTTAKAFDILSSGLYTDNILAVIRELSCNAYDAHIAADNKNTPFEIHLPNDLEPWFSVKDFGIGLSDEDVTGLYTTYFESTKSDSNDYIGALGLGSKSPFSYASSFEVIARFESVRSLYTVFINEHGVPTIANMGSVPTDEPNGLEIKVAIKKDDFREFRRKTATIVRWFEVQPKVVGNVSYEPEKLPESTISGNRWYLLPRNYSDPELTAVQGNVAYRVKLSALELDDEYRQLLKTGHLVLTFDIGDLEVAASREEIRYDKRSVDALNKTISLFFNEIKQNIEDRANGLDGIFWDQILYLDEMSKEIFGSSISLKKFMKETTNPVLQRYVEQNGELVVNPVGGYLIYRYFNKGRGYNNNATFQRELVLSILSPHKTRMVFLMDVNKSGIRRLGDYYDKNSVKDFIVIMKNKKAVVEEKDDDGNVITTEYTDADYQKDYESIVYDLGDVHIHSVKDDTVAPDTTVNLELNHKGFYVLNGTKKIGKASYYSNRKTVQVWDQIPGSTDLNSIQGLYVELRNRRDVLTTVIDEKVPINWNDEYNVVSPSNCIKLINKHYGFNFNTSDIYGVNTPTYNKLEKNPNTHWHNMFDLMRSIVPKYADGIMFFDKFNNTDDIIDIKSLLGNQKFMRRIYKMDEDSVLKQAFVPMHKDWEKYFTARTDIEVMRKFDSNYGIKLFNDLPTIQYYDVKELIKKYPMLGFTGITSHVINQHGNNALDVLFEYIRLIDRS